MSHFKKLKRIIDGAPDLPGVYLFKDENGEILYVGKAKNLRNRLRSYLQTAALEYRKKIMMHHASDVDYIVVGSEKDAFILEKNLIQENQPHYNVALKDGKSYPYVKITVKEKYPAVSVIRKPGNDGSKYFGPYTSVKAVRRLLSELRNLFPYRHCRRMPSRVCLQYHLGRCPGPCEKQMEEGEYKKNINALIAVFRGKGKNLYQEIESKMNTCADKLEFEKAAEYREQLEGLKQILFLPDMEQHSLNTYDTASCERTGDLFSVYILSTKEGKVMARENRVFESSDHDALTSFLYIHYAEMPAIPPLIIAEIGDDAPLLEKELSGKAGYPVVVRSPENEEEKKMYSRATENANFYLLKHFITGLHNYFDELEEALDFSGINSIDAFDISNYGAEQFVGASIRLSRQGFEKNKYRHFNIESGQQDDFRMIKEIVKRRYRNGDYPDLILIDGGPVQVRFARMSLEELDAAVPLLGLAKREETVISAEGDPLDMNGFEKARLLLMKARDEVHRFGITFNRRKKRKKMVRNPLENLPGLGKKRAEMLMEFFGTIEAVQHAGIGDLMKVPGIGRFTAEKIHEILKTD